MPDSRILLLESDVATGAAIAAALGTLGYTITQIADPDEAFRQAHDHQLVIVDVVAGPKSALEICREIRGTPALASIPVLCMAQTDQVDERIGFLEAGADDVMVKPIDDRELEARLEALLLRFDRSRDLAPTVGGADGMLGRRHRVVTVFSPKGGVGTTTTAVNIAVAEARRKPDRVVLVDLALQFGTAATHLNLEARQSIADVVREEAALREPELLRTFAARHDVGLHLLAAPPSPELAELVEAGHVEAMLSTALGTWDEVVVDAGSRLDDRTLVALDQADVVVIPVYPEIAALKSVHALLDYLNDAGSVGSKTTFVLNNVFAREILKLRDIESALGTKIALDLPYDPFIYQKAVNEGVPVVIGAPRSVAAERFGQLAASSFGAPAAAQAAAPERRGLLGGLIRRS